MPGEKQGAVNESEWAKFGLDKKEPPRNQRFPPVESGEYYPATSGPGDLYQEELLKKVRSFVWFRTVYMFLFTMLDLSTTDEADNRPWWSANFFLREPVLFGTWDGVFTSVMVNIFGVIVFLKTGWMVGNAGINEAVLILLLCLSLALFPVLSSIGICERCQIQSGGVYFLISHILGGQIGGAVGLLYAFGQAVATSLVSIGFGESMAHVFGTDNAWVVRAFAFFVLVALVGINVAGVKWVIKLQLFLLVLLVLAVIDLTFGSFVTYSPPDVVGLTSENWQNNTGPAYQEGQNFFSVFGVFFSTFTGVLAGVNMSGDLKDPSRNIPLGELAAVGSTGGFCLLFILTLGGACGRTALLNNVMIAEQVSLTKIFFLSGLYVSSLSSILGSLYGAPRVLQSIAAENVIPFIKPLEAGRGPNKVPVLATVVLTGVSIVFIMVREMNTLALIATMPFLITYAFVNYAYVSLAMTFDIQQTRERIFYPGTATGGLPASYGSMDGLKAAAIAEGATNTGDLDHLFPERQQQRLGRGGPPPPPPAANEAEGANLVPQTDDGGEAQLHEAGPTLLKKEGKPTIINQPLSWYSKLCNRWVALVGAVVNLMIIFLAHLGFAFANLLLLVVVYFYIGQAAPGVFPGISEFSIPSSIQLVVSRLRGQTDDDQIIVAPNHPGVSTLASTLTEDNTDYANRDQYHQAKTQPLTHEFD